MKIRLALLGIFLGCVGCSKSNDQDDFIAIWESVEKNHEKVVLTFYKDSLILDAFSGSVRTTSNWSFDKKRIYLKNIREGANVILDTISYGYEFTKSKDSLTLTIPIGINDEENSTLVKVEKSPFTHQ